jgi:hypothetical protein
MPGPGASRADVTEGLTRVEHLPTAQVICRRHAKRRTGPRGRSSASRRRRVARRLHALGDLVSGGPAEIPRTSAPHHGSGCGQYVHADTADVALPGRHDTPRVMAVAGRVVVEDWGPDRAASWPLGRDHRVCVPCATIPHGVDARGATRGRTDGLGRPCVGSG